MSVERAIEAFAGFMVLLSVLLTELVHPAFVWLTVFVGANLLQQAFTRFCPAAVVMRKLGLKPERELALGSSAGPGGAKGPA
jgi:Inner membrane protein YgaP-like, transmembrane domain